MGSFIFTKKTLNFYNPKALRAMWQIEKILRKYKIKRKNTCKIFKVIIK